MDNVLNFSQHRPPILKMMLGDEVGTVLHVTPPTVELQEELRETQDNLRALLAGDNDEIRAALFDLAARLMSCNRNMLAVTSEDLRRKYNIDEEDLVLFYQSYNSFISGLEHAKN